MNEECIIFDETNGNSSKGRYAKLLAETYNIKYVTTIEELKKAVTK